MELESKDRKQRNYNTFLTVFVAVTFTVALLQGVGLVIFYTHFQAANNALEARVAAVEARELAVASLEVPASSNTGEPPATNAKCDMSLSHIPHDCSHAQHPHSLTSLHSIQQLLHVLSLTLCIPPLPDSPASETVKRSADNSRYRGSYRYPSRDCKCPAGPPGPPGKPGDDG